MIHHHKGRHEWIEVFGECVNCLFCALSPSTRWWPPPILRIPSHPFFIGNEEKDTSCVVSWTWLKNKRRDHPYSTFDWDVCLVSTSLDRNVQMCNWLHLVWDIWATSCIQVWDFGANLAHASNSETSEMVHAYKLSYHMHQYSLHCLHFIYRLLYLQFCHAPRGKAGLWYW